MKRFICIVYLLFVTSISVNSVNVGGHITQDTTWSLDNSPYNVINFLYIDSGVTLTIEPGVRVNIGSADMTDIHNFMWSNSNEPIAKSIIVNGRINANGTKLMPIIFDTDGMNAYYRWGVIYISEQAAESGFEYCTFRNSFFSYITPSIFECSAIRFKNGHNRIRYCTFENNYNCITGSLDSDMLIYGCRFSSFYNDYPNPFAFNGFMSFAPTEAEPPDHYHNVTVARCYFTGYTEVIVEGYYMRILMLENKNYRLFHGNTPTSRINENGPTSSYGNISIDSYYGSGCRSFSSADTSYCRRNTVVQFLPLSQDGSFISAYGAITEDGMGNCIVSDNHIQGNAKIIFQNLHEINIWCYNNVVESTAPYGLVLDNFHWTFDGEVRIFNNVFTDMSLTNNVIVFADKAAPKIYNNTFNRYGVIFTPDGPCAMTLTNNIIDGFYRYSALSFDTSAHPLLLNNCLEIPIPGTMSYLDGGDNIYTDPLFADTLNYNFNLTAGSPCIDTGITMDWMPAFDANYNQRITGSAPDMGAYEYKSQYIGGIRGNVYDAHTNQIIDCAQVKISGKLPEFSDTLGLFTYPTGAGTYTVTVTRWDYADVIIPNVVVTLGQETLLNIAMQDSTVANDDDTLPINDSNISLYNYPNPFKANTKISFILPEKGNTKLEIYNTKGQKVKTLLNGIGQKGYNNISWNGRDDNGKIVASGMYFTRVEQAGKVKTGKMLMLK